VPALPALAGHEVPQLADAAQGASVGAGVLVGADAPLLRKSVAYHPVPFN